MEQEFNNYQNQRIKKMAKLITSGIVGFFLLIFLFMSCERIDAGHVGVKVNLYGSQKGVDGITEVTGMVFYNPLTTKVYEFPSFVQHKEYTGEESFTINSRDGSEFRVAPILNYQVITEKVPFIFGKYRKSLDNIEVGFLKTAVYDAFRIATNSYTADSLISNREGFEARVRGILEKQLNAEGFLIQQFTSNLEYPKTFVDAINAKNNAVQQALKAENDVRTAEANAKIRVANAQGNADALIVQAKAESEANRLKQQTLTSLLLQQQWIEKWDGKLPVYGQAPMLYKPVN
jgi:regulator of protease activity HflC (stomatin/prohibitin superfamily)